jgi:hypothetical protein
MPPRITLTPEAQEAVKSFLNESNNTGFVMTSEKPFSEWDGFGVCTISMICLSTAASSFPEGRGQDIKFIFFKRPVCVSNKKLSP